MWSVSLKHYKCKEDSSGSYIIHDGRLRAGYARVTSWQGVEWRKTTKNTLQYFEDEADYRLLLVSMQVSIIILILRAESPILTEISQCAAMLYNNWSLQMGQMGPKITLGTLAMSGDDFPGV